MFRKRRRKTRRLLLQPLESRTVLSASNLLSVDLHEVDGHHLDLSGNEYDILSQLPDPRRTSEPGRGLVSQSTPAALSDTFFLHSQPDAAHTIYLDFDGHTTTGTAWNSSFTGGQSIVTPAYNFSGSSSSFSDSELQRIQRIWERVTEDFIPFDVDVTTEDPGASALRKSGGSDSAWGIRVVIGGNSNDWFGAGAGGVAYVGSFTWSSDTPTFVFSENLAGGSEKSVAEAISHEVGHTLGLSHDGRTSPSETYYGGHGSGETGWAPIMGVGYYETLSQWSKGEYANANRFEDDLAIITGGNGFGYRSDDHGDTSSAATPLIVSGTSLSEEGVIERNTDVDVFRFSTGGGEVQFDVNPVDRGPNLDIEAALRDTNQNLIAVSNPSSLLGASLAVTLAAGEYFLEIDGVGKGDPLGTGYTDYASLGQYFITGTVESAAGSVSIVESGGTTSVAEGGAGDSYTLVLTAAPTHDVEITVSPDSQVSTSPTTVVFTPSNWSTPQNVTVGAVDDGLLEGAHSGAISHSVSSSDSAYDQIPVAGVTVDITDNEQPLPSVSIEDAEITEGDSGTRDLVFTVRLSESSSQTVSVEYATRDGSAMAGGDFVAESGSVVFLPGETSRSVTISILGDTYLEGDQSFSVDLSAASNATLDDATATGTIRGDDNSIRFSTPLSEYREGAADSFLVRPAFPDTRQFVELVNDDDVAMTVESIEINAIDVSLSRSLPAVIPAGQTLVVGLTYAPETPNSTDDSWQSFDEARGLVIRSDSEQLSVVDVRLRGDSTFDSDINYDGIVNYGDLGPYNLSFLSEVGDPNYDPTADINGDGTINLSDLGPFLSDFLKSRPLPESAAATESSLAKIPESGKLGVLDLHNRPIARRDASNRAAAVADRPVDEEGYDQFIADVDELMADTSFVRRPSKAVEAAGNGRS